MKITSDSELTAAVESASELIQAIHDYAGRDFSKKWKLQFPRGYVRTASEHRARLPFLQSSPLKDNIAYTLILSDTTHWLLVRTDVTATIRQQLIKLHLFLLGSLVESITAAFLKGKCGKRYKGRTAFLMERGRISPDMKADLDWLWDMRNKMHLFQVSESEHMCPHYTIKEHNRAVRAFRDLVTHLQ